MGKRLRVPYKIYKRGNLYWAYFTIVDAEGRRHRIRETTGASSIEKAEQYCNARISILQKEINRKKLNEPQNITVNTAFGDFYEKHGQYYARPDETLRKLGKIKSNISVKYLHEIDNNEISDYIQRRKSEVSNATINRELVILSSILTKCRLWKYKTSDAKPLKFKLKEKAENVKYFD